MRRLQLFLLSLLLLATFLPLTAGDANDALLDAAKNAYNLDDFTAARASLDKLLAAKPTADQTAIAKLFQARMLEEENQAADAIKQFDALATDEKIDSAIATEARLLWCRACIEHNLADRTFRDKLQQVNQDNLSPRLKALFVLEIGRFFLASRQMELLHDGRGEMEKNRDILTDPNDRAQFDIFIARTYARSANDPTLLEGNASIFAATGVKPGIRMQAALTLAIAYLSNEDPEAALDWLKKAAQLPNPLPHRLGDLGRYTALAQSGIGNTADAFATLAKARAIKNLPTEKIAVLWMAEADIALNIGDVPQAQQAAAAAIKLGGLTEAQQGAVLRVQKIVVDKPVPKLLFDPANPELQTDWYFKWCGAVRRDDPAAIKALANQGIEPGSKLAENDVTALHVAAGMGRTKSLQALLDLKVSPNIRDTEQRTPLMLAAQSGREAVVRLLAAQNADLNAVDKYRINALHMAASMGRLAIVKFLVAQKMDINAKGENDWTPLHCAANYQHLEIVQFLVENGADIEARSDHDETAMLLSTKQNNSAVTRYLATAKSPAKHAPPQPQPADTKKSNREANIALVTAAMGGTAEEAQKAIDAGADINTVDGEIPRYPLIWAARQGNLAVVKLLVEKGVDINQIDRLMSKTALDLANLRNNEELAAYLKAHGAKTSEELK